MAYEATWRDQLAQRVCNVVMKLASKEYRAWMTLGMYSALDRAASELQLERLRDPRMATITVVVEADTNFNIQREYDEDGLIQLLTLEQIKFMVVQPGITPGVMGLGYDPEVRSES